MADFGYLQNTQNPDGTTLIIEWPMDVVERYCLASPIGADGDAGRSIVPVGNAACNWHSPTAADGHLCDIAERTPPDCRHRDSERVPDSTVFFCRICDRHGDDVTEKWAQKLGRYTPPSAAPGPAPEEGPPAASGPGEEAP